MTAKEAARLTHDLGGNHTHEIQEFIRQALPAELQEFMHGISAHTGNVYFNWARTALDIRVAENLEKQTERLENQMVELVGIAAEQKRLALELDRMTKKLINLTAWLKWLTIALVFLTCILCLFELRRREHVSQIGLNPAQVTPHIDQSIGNAQKNTNH
jgi:hypothetical protein